MIVTNKVIETLNPCKNRYNNYLKFYKGKEHTKAQFLGLKNITQEDKLWVAFRLMPKENISKCAAEIARLVLYIYEEKYPNDLRPRKAIEAAEIGSPDANAASHAASHAAYAAYDAAHAVAAHAAYAAYDAAHAAHAAYAAYDAAHAVAAHAAASHAAAHVANAVAANADIQKKIRTIILKWWK